MGNNRNRESFFRFKKFNICDSAGAMKIGTDGVLLGAWAPAEGIQRALDIGCGTGLIAMMLAQRGVSKVIGIEIGEEAAREAEDNVASCEWRDRIEIIAGNALAADFSAYNPDLIVSNPPFFSDSLKCEDSCRTIARHAGSLSFVSLLESGAKWLSEDGQLAFISPAYNEHEIEYAAAMNKLYINKKTFVCTVEGKRAKRILWLLNRRICRAEISTLNIKNRNGEYSGEYTLLTKEFYLNL